MISSFESVIAVSVGCYVDCQYQYTLSNNLRARVPQWTKHLSRLLDKYAVVPTDKASNNIVNVYKLHYIEYLI
jgi:hypothetical protein